MCTITTEKKGKNKEVEREILMSFTSIHKADQCLDCQNTQKKIYHYHKKKRKKGGIDEFYEQTWSEPITRWQKPNQEINNKGTKKGGGEGLTYFAKHT